uniref:Acetyl-CoA acetyltransferase n=1 Tax=Ascaris lumbricoides TaxID=6252 RepID=A0A0M3ILR9_ASCLU
MTIIPILGRALKLNGSAGGLPTTPKFSVMDPGKKDVYILSAVRTPIASFRSTLTSLSAVDLGIVVTKEAIKRSLLPSSAIEETIVGNVLSAGLGQNIARQISIASEIPKSSQCVTINKVCSSSMKAIIMGAQAIQVGYRRIVVAVGSESMSNAPFYVPRGEIPFGGVQLVDALQRDGLMDSIEYQPMGLCAEKTVKDYAFTREQLDAYAIESYRKAEHAWKEGAFNKEVVPVSVPQKRGSKVVLTEDEEYKRLIPEKVPALHPAFLKDGSGTITAANASTINDGAAACVLASGEVVQEGRLKPIAKVLSYAEAGVEPIDFTVAPALAVKQLLSQSGLDEESIALWEINEAFSVTGLAFIKELRLDPKRVNVRGGAVALGHPLGASGARIVVTLVHALKSDELGVAAICNGGGEASAILIKKL